VRAFPIGSQHSCRTRGTASSTRGGRDRGIADPFGLRLCRRTPTSGSEHPLRKLAEGGLATGRQPSTAQIEAIVRHHVLAPVGSPTGVPGQRGILSTSCSLSSLRLDRKAPVTHAVVRRVGAMDRRRDRVRSSSCFKAIVAFLGFDHCRDRRRLCLRSGPIVAAIGGDRRRPLVRSSLRSGLIIMAFEGDRRSHRV
jgi:hypothetical protein